MKPRGPPCKSIKPGAAGGFDVNVCKRVGQELMSCSASADTEEKARRAEAICSTLEPGS